MIHVISNLLLHPYYLEFHNPIDYDYLPGILLLFMEMGRNKYRQKGSITLCCSFVYIIHNSNDFGKTNETITFVFSLIKHTDIYKIILNKVENCIRFFGNNKIEPRSEL